jgi:flagellar P-ring protein FlgI
LPQELIFFADHPDTSRSTMHRLIALVLASLAGAVWLAPAWAQAPAAATAARPANAPAATVVASTSFAGQRIKEVAQVQGVRSNQLTGYGLVVGLDGTGDQTTQMPYTAQGLQNYLQQLGITVPPAATSQLQLKNVAAVLVTATLPAFARPGQPLDVNVSSIGNARSLRGGTLITTPLRGVDGEIYALAQGNLMVGGAGASAGGSRVQINHLSAGRIPNGGQVERSVPTPLQSGPSVLLGLNAQDFSMAREVALTINRNIGENMARALDGRTVEVTLPADPNERIKVIADIEELRLRPTQAAARVVINARTGSVVMNGAVTLNPAAVAHGSLSVVIQSTPVISQPAPFSQGQTVVTEQTSIQINQEPGNIIQVPQATQLGEVVKALNALGATPQDLLAVLQALKAAGALNAELEVI